MQQSNSKSLKAHLQVLPGLKYRALGKVVATDGSLRTRKHKSGELSMAAGIASEMVPFEGGVHFLSTRSELVTIAVALRYTGQTDAGTCCLQLLRRQCSRGPQIKKRITQVMGQKAWEERTNVGSVDKFMRRENAGRHLLGQDLCSTWDWVVWGWILAVSPYNYPVKSN